VLSGLAIADLAVGVDPSKKKLAVLLDHHADPWAFDDVSSDADDDHEGVRDALR